MAYFNETNKFTKKTDRDCIIAKMSALSESLTKTEKDLIALKEDITNAQNILSDMKNRYQKNRNTLS